MARTKRVSTKAKEPTNGTQSTRSTPTADATVVSPPSVTLSPPQPSASVVLKPSILPNLSEQRNQQQEEFSHSSDSINEQKWHMVSSTRGQRRGPSTSATTRRELADESQKANRMASKSTVPNAGKAAFLLVSTVCVRLVSPSPPPPPRSMLSLVPCVSYRLYL